MSRQSPHLDYLGDRVGDMTITSFINHEDRLGNKTEMVELSNEQEVLVISYAALKELKKQ